MNLEEKTKRDLYEMRAELALKISELQHEKAQADKELKKRRGG